MKEVNEYWLPDYKSSIDRIIIEEIIQKTAIRKAYGAKPKSALNFSDETSVALWCWEIQDFSLFDSKHVNEASLKRIRGLRQAIGRKLMLLNLLIEMVDDFSTFDSEEKLIKLNNEFENYTKLLIKERAGES